jgi:hypothetical protein
VVSINLSMPAGGLLVAIIATELVLLYMRVPFYRE